MLKRIIVVLLLVLIIIIGNKARSFSYASVPQPGENSDEYAYAWAGLTLLTKGKPEAWSQFPNAYENVRKEKVNVDHIYETNKDQGDFVLVSPWFDNPPMLGLITGGYAYLKGFRTIDSVSVITIRRPMLKIAILTTILIYVFASLLFNVNIGLLAAFLYSVIPSVVMSTRLALAENAIAPMFLFSAIFTYLFLKNRNRKYWIIACIFGSISIWFKISAISISLSLFFIALIFGGKEKFALVRTLLLISLLAVGAYILYGFILGFDEFIKLFIVQSQRFYGASSEAFYQAFTRAKVTKYLTDGWLNMAWVSAFILSFNGLIRSRYQPIITVFLFSYLIVFLVFGSEAYGHYRIPFYPFLIICASKILVDLFKKPNMYVFLGLILLPLGTTIHRLIGVMEFQKYVTIFRYGLFAALFIYFLSLIKPKGGIWVQRLFMIIVLFLTIYLSVKEIYFFNIDKWYFAD